MYDTAAQMIKNAKRCIAFTGAGISVESGIPPFRGKNGLWNKYDPMTFDISYFNQNPAQAWSVMRDIFYELFGRVKPNPAHYAVAELEARELIQGVITQNVDNLHHDAGSKVVHEFHGSLKKITCQSCRSRFPVNKIDLNVLPPPCPKCAGLLKPGVVFFGENIPESASMPSFSETDRADCLLLIGTTGEVAPANLIPSQAKSNGAKIIEINPEPSLYTPTVTDVFLKEKAVYAMENLMDEIDRISS